MTDNERLIRTHDDLLEAWHMIDGGHGYSAPQLFAFHVDADGVMLRDIMHVYDEEFNDELDESFMRTFLSLQAQILATTLPGGSLAVMRARPGSASLTPSDLAFCRAMHRHLVAATFTTWPLAFASDRSVGLVPADDLIGATAS